MKKWVVFFLIIMGVMMAGMWSFFLVSGMVPELETAPLTIATHLAAEFGTAFAMLISGILLLRKNPLAEKIALVALGMFIYAVIQAPGYYLQQGSIAFGVMFLVLLLVGFSAVWTIIQSQNRR